MLLQRTNCVLCFVHAYCVISSNMPFVIQRIVLVCEQSKQARQPANLQNRSCRCFLCACERTTSLFTVSLQSTPVVLIFFASFTLQQNQRQCLLCQGMILCQGISGKSEGQILLDNRCKLTLRCMNLCAYWNQFQGNACTKLISL